jgi:hypothetical protein
MLTKLSRWLVLSLVLSLTLSPLSAQAASAGIFPSGGTTAQAGQTFTISVKASGATFDSLQGTISVSGPVSIVSFSAGGATWLPGKAPGNNTQFVGIASATSSLTVATIKLKGTKEGKGSVSVSGVRLARSGAEVGSAGGSTAFTITRALVPPGAITVSSTTHPDQEASYEATTVELTWDKPSGVTGFSYLFDDAADTTPPTTVTSADTNVKYENVAIGTHYFHIRAINGDGWGSATHFKVTVKEPDPKVDETLAKATITNITLSEPYVNDVTAGTITNLTLEGAVESGYATNIALLPKPTLPEEAKLTSDVSTDGTWRLTIPTAIPSGFYTVTAQGQKEKVLTPASEPTMIQLSVAKGGSVTVITDSDINKPARTDIVRVLGVTLKKNTLGWIGVVVADILILAGVYVLWRWRSRRRASNGLTPKKLS